MLRLKGIPIVTWYAHRQLTQTLKLAHPFSDRMVSINESSYPYINDKLICVGHGVNTHLFSPDTTALDNPPLLLSVGRLSRTKGLITLLEALHFLRQRGCSVCCAFIGDAPASDRRLRRRPAPKGASAKSNGFPAIYWCFTNDQVVSDGRSEGARWLHF